MTPYKDRLGLERCPACCRLATDRPASNELFAAAVRALRYFENQAAGKPNGGHEDLLCGEQLKAALAKLEVPA